MENQNTTVLFLSQEPGVSWIDILKFLMARGLKHVKVKHTTPAILTGDILICKSGHQAKVIETTPFIIISSPTLTSSRLELEFNKVLVNITNKEEGEKKIKKDKKSRVSIK